MEKSGLIKDEGVSAEVRTEPAEAKPAKKKFVAPEVSVPVDVLEATTFFQLTDSGATN